MNLNWLTTWFRRTRHIPRVNGTARDVRDFLADIGNVTFTASEIARALRVKTGKAYRVASVQRVLGRMHKVENVLTTFGRQGRELRYCRPKGCIVHSASGDILVGDQSGFRIEGNRVEGSTAIQLELPNDKPLEVK